MKWKLHCLKIDWFDIDSTSPLFILSNESKSQNNSIRSENFSIHDDDEMIAYIERRALAFVLCYQHMVVYCIHAHSWGMEIWLSKSERHWMQCRMLSLDKYLRSLTSVPNERFEINFMRSQFMTKKKSFTHLSHRFSPNSISSGRHVFFLLLIIKTISMRSVSERQLDKTCEQ